MNATPGTSRDEGLHRQLIEQLYNTSLQRYGADSEQTRLFAEHLSSLTAKVQFHTQDDAILS